MDPMSQYVAAVQRSVLTKNGASLAGLYTGRACADALRFCPASQIPSAVQRGISEEGWARLVTAFLLSELAASSGDAVRASEQFIECVKELSKLFRDESATWMIPLVTRVAGVLYARTRRADSELRARRAEAGYMEDGARTLNDIVRHCVRGDKRPALLKLTNVMCKYYFATNKLGLCKNAFQLFEPYASPGAAKVERKRELREQLSEYPAAQVVTYLYLKGRVALVAGDYRDAQELLQEAFARCPSNYFKNKRLILQALVVVGLVLGRLPAEAALRKYRLTHFYGIVRAVRSGDLKAFDENLDAVETFLIRNGAYTAIESVRLICLRRMLKKVYLINGKKEQMLLTPVTRVLYDSVGEDEFSDVECAVANLIYVGLVKGYISHTHKCLVVSKSSPFPPLGETYERLYPRN